MCSKWGRASNTCFSCVVTFFLAFSQEGVMFCPPTRVPKQNDKNWRLESNSYSFSTRQTRNKKSKTIAYTWIRSYDFSVKIEHPNHCANFRTYRKLDHFTFYVTDTYSNNTNCLSADTCTGARGYGLSSDVFKPFTKCVCVSRSQVLEHPTALAGIPCFTKIRA